MKMRTQFGEYLVLAKYHNLVVLQGSDDRGWYTLVRPFDEVAAESSGEQLVDMLAGVAECLPVVEAADVDYLGETSYDLLYGSAYVMAVVLPGPVVLLFGCSSWSDALDKLQTMPEPFARWAQGDGPDMKQVVDETYAFRQPAMRVELWSADYGLHFVNPASL